MRRLGGWLSAVCAVLMLSAFGGGGVAPDIAAMTAPRMLHTATLLADGKVLITGGVVSIDLVALDSAELYDPTAKTFTALTARMTSLRNQHTATRLPNGLVLIAGGSNNGDGDGMNTAEIYNPATQTFTALAATLTTPRGGHTATLLKNGRVLLTGGFFNSSSGLATAELYDPATQAFTAIAGTMTSAREGHAAALLRNGQVLVTGGSTSHVGLNTAEVYNPATQTFSALAATTTIIRMAHTATALPNGQVLLVGGAEPGFSTLDFAALDSAELYDPVANRFTAMNATLATPRGGHTATLLPNSKVLFTGGGTGSHTLVEILDTAEIGAR